MAIRWFAPRRNCAGVRFIKPLNQGEDGCFAGPARPDKSGNRTRLCRERDIRQNGFVLTVAKTDLMKR